MYGLPVKYGYVGDGLPMILFEAGGVVLLVMLALWLFALVDCISTDSALCRNLPKPLWLMIVFFLPDIGSILWLLLGRPERARWTPGSTDYTTPRHPLGYEDEPRYSAIAGVTERRSEELDREIARWEEEQQREQRHADLERREAELRRRELELRERELERRERDINDS
jgi:hypothetical protein